MSYEHGEKFDLVLTGSLLRQGSPLRRMLSDSDLAERVLHSDLDSIPLHQAVIERVQKAAASGQRLLLGGAFFESFLHPAYPIDSFLAELATALPETLTAQISFGRESRNAMSEIRKFLEHGHQLQVWFENAKDLPLIQKTFKPYGHQVVPVYVPFERNPAVSMPTDANVHYLSPSSPEGIVVVRSFEPATVQSATWFAFFYIWLVRTLFTGRMALPLSVLHEFRSFCLFFADPAESLRLSAIKAREASANAADGAFSPAQLFNDARVKLEMARIRGYWRAYRAGGTLKVLAIQTFWFAVSFGTAIFWSLYRFASQIKMIAITSHWKTYRAGGTLKVFLVQCVWAWISLAWRLAGSVYALSIRAFWLAYGLATSAREGLRRLRWLAHDLYSQSLGRLVDRGVKIYWRCVDRYTELRRVLRAVRWQAYSWLTRFAGECKRSAVALYWSGYRLSDSLRLRFIAARWSLYAVVDQAIGAVRAHAVETYWRLNRLGGAAAAKSLQLRWQIYSAASEWSGRLRAWRISTYWSLISFWQAIASRSVQWWWQLYAHTHSLRLTSVQFYWEARNLLQTTAWPLRKVFWFLSYQWSKRIAPRGQRG